jgi:class 3 adenylate cyclase
MMSTVFENSLDWLQEILRDHNAAARWHSFIAGAQDDQLRRINAYELADWWNLDGRLVLTELVHATRAGVMVLNWDVVCPMCGDANQYNHLDKVHSRQACKRCAADFEVILDETVQVSFTVHPGIRELAPSAAGSSNNSATRRVTGLDCATLPAFREFFASQVLSTDESLQVRDAAIMFTDIKGSTELYERLGDVLAYRAVRLHFEKLFCAVLVNSGAIIKTIGDAVMASFTKPCQAMLAALEAQEMFQEFRPLLPDSTEAITVKIGIHHGSCIAVTLNDRLDLFGTTVNIAARAQQQAGGQEVIITEIMYRDPQVRVLLDREKLSISSLQTRLRGLSSDFMLYRISNHKATNGEQL